MFPDILCCTFINIFFSGMEIASYLISKASSITVIGSSELPYQNTLGPEIGRATMMVRKSESWVSPHITTVSVQSYNGVASADAVREKRDLLHE